MTRRQRRTLLALFSEPVSGNIKWREVESLVESLGGEVMERKGSGIRMELNGVRLFVHRPHATAGTGRVLLRRVRVFLENAGVDP